MECKNVKTQLQLYLTDAEGGESGVMLRIGLTEISARHLLRATLQLLLAVPTTFTVKWTINRCSLSLPLASASTSRTHIILVYSHIRYLFTRLETRLDD